MHGTHYKPRLFCQRIWNNSGLALFAGSIVLATVTEAEEPNTEIQREKVAAEEDLQAQQNVSLPTATDNPAVRLVSSVRSNDSKARPGIQ